MRRTRQSDSEAHERGATVSRRGAAKNNIPVEVGIDDLTRMLVAVGGKDFPDAVKQPGITLRSRTATHGDKLRAADMLKGWLLGADRQRAELTGPNGSPLLARIERVIVKPTT